MNENREDQLVQRARATLHSKNPICSRALRRGGLSALSLLGNSNADIRTLSRHTTDDSLRIYLGAGLLDATLAKTQHKLILQIETSASFSVSPFLEDDCQNKM